ncbi:hypothetical protein J2X61_003113 [Bacillus sp. 3255]|nr:hypothetical protein [Bacillus sp. 3255]
MDPKFINRLHTLNRRDELRSMLLLEGLRLTLKRRRNASFLHKLIFKRKKPVIIAKGWN